MDSLRSLALAVSAGRPVLVQGPVGCGKTLLVQQLASLTGRHSAPQIIKVQLGDQTDSKVNVCSLHDRLVQEPIKETSSHATRQEAFIHSHLSLLSHLGLFLA